jgi:FtsZ-binding cell division protein ZapB
MDETTTTTTNAIAEWVKLGGVTGVGGLVAALFTKFAFRKFAEEETASQGAKGESDIIELLRSEVDRLAGMNEQLSKKLAELQTQIINLRSENAELKGEIQALNLQLKRFPNENVQ